MTAHRALQLQILTWLAGIAVVGAIARPSLDGALFAGAFVVGTALLRVRESWKWAEMAANRSSALARGTLPDVRDRRVLGDSIGVIVAWSAAVARMHWPSVAHLPNRLDVGTLVLAATLPSAALLLRIVNAVRRRARLRGLD